MIVKKSGINPFLRQMALKKRERRFALIRPVDALAKKAPSGC